MTGIPKRLVLWFTDITNCFFTAQKTKVTANKLTKMIFVSSDALP